ncbi:hypothetical protein NPIL_64461 [Nephila pilipes]|uniref:Uncharacterized protein n=1 Tax=Nephila pilipes TaxID=299642 RepID=A0A8X6NBC4_NEPPI|nr:hypothetical protein NPIL_64461 [Nephila pilipes]
MNSRDGYRSGEGLPGEEEDDEDTAIEKKKPQEKKTNYNMTCDNSGEGCPPQMWQAIVPGPLCEVQIELRKIYAMRYFGKRESQGSYPLTDNQTTVAAKQRTLEACQYVLTYTAKYG